MDESVPDAFFQLKDVDGLNFESAREMFRNRIADLCKQHIYLGDSGRVNEMDRKVFWQLADTVDGSPSDAELKTSLSLLMKMMQDHYGRQVILLLDEYDVPLAKSRCQRILSTNAGSGQTVYEYGGQG